MLCAKLGSLGLFPVRGSVLMRFLFRSSLTFSTLLLSNSPSCSRSASPSLYTLPCCLCNIPYPFATTRAKKNTQRRQTTPLQGEDEHRDEHDDDDGVAFALTVSPPPFFHDHPRPFFLYWHILIRNGSILIRIGIAGIVIVVAVALSLSPSLSSPFSLTLPATVWFPFDADKL